MELNQYEEKMKKSLANLEEEYGAIRAGRANPRILDRIQVELLWNTDFLAWRCQYFCTGSPHDSDSAVGCRSY